MAGVARAGCLLFLTGLLAACGGGGSDGGSNPPGATAPTITTQPTNLAVSDGQAATFSVAASGSSPLSYQWQVNGADISGATTESFVLDPASLADDGTQYTVTVSNSAGSVNSSSASLTVNPIAAAITAGPQSVTVTAGQPASFSVTTAGSAPLTFQWTRDGTDITGATTATLNIPAVSPADNGARFAVRVNNAGGSATSTEAVLTVDTIAPGIVTQPTSVTASDGQGVMFSVVASGSEPLSYQWRRDGAPITGATTSSYSIAAATPGDSGAQFTVSVTNTAGTVTSAAAVLTVTAVPPSIMAQPQAQTVTDGANATFSVVANGTLPLQYQWFKNGTPIGTNSSTLTLAAVPYTDNGATITVTVSNPSPTTVTSNGALLTVSPRAPAITVQPQPRTVADGATASFSVTATGTAPLHYQWKRNGANVGTDNRNYTTPALTLADDGASYTVVVSNAASTTATSNAATVTVTPVPPSITTQPQSRSAATGATATFTVTAAGSAPLHYQWKRDGADVGTDSASYTTGVLSSGDSGATFTVVVSNATSTTATSNAATLTVVDSGLAILAGAIGGTGFDDGTGSAARFYNPLGIATDSSGNAYIADQSNHLIRRVTPAGVATTLAGSPGAATFANGTGAAARFNTPTDLTVYEPSPGDVRLFIADSGNNRIRQLVVATGVVTTLAGSGTAGSTDGSAGTARFRAPSGITLSGGQLFVADTSNDTLRVVTLGGAVSTWAGAAQQAGTTDGNGSNARFNNPLGLAADASGTLYVADCSNNTVRSVSPTQDVITLAGTPAVAGNVDGAPNNARFRCPSGLVVDGTGSNLYVADSNNRTVRRIALPSGNVSTYASVVGAGGTAGPVGAADGPVGSARFSRPYGIALDQNGDLVLTDATNSEIRHIDLTNDVVATLSGSIGGRGYANGVGAAARFNDPHNIAIDTNGNIYVSDYANAVIRKVAPDSTVTTLAGSPGVTGSSDGTGAGARFAGPRGLAVDAAGNIFVADAANNTIRRVTPLGVVTTFAGATTAGYINATGTAARFSNPVAVTVDSNGNVYVSDYNNNAIRKITPARVVTTLAGGGPAAPGTTDANGTNARFNGPRGVAVDGADNVIVADRDNGTIRIVTPAGDTSTLAGLPGTSGYANGTGTGARFNWPNNPAVDAAGNIYVPDANNSAIRKITPAGVVTTVVGDPPPGAVRQVVLGALPGQLNGPSGVVVLPGSPTRLVIAESAENALLIATLP